MIDTVGKKSWSAVVVRYAGWGFHIAGKARCFAHTPKAFVGNNPVCLLHW